MAPDRKDPSLRRKVLRGAGLTLLAAVLALIGIDRVVASAGGGRIHEPALAPVTDVAMVLGTTPTTRGRPNAFFEARLDAAADLWRAGRVRGFLLTGDHSRPGYDEPSAMRDGLVARGVPADVLTLDYAGRSTLDSVARAGPVFGVRRALVVSQRFHLERALYLARSFGLEAEGVAAADASLPFHLRTRVRETFARAKAVADVAFGKDAWVLGAPVEVRLAE